MIWKVWEQEIKGHDAWDTVAETFLLADLGTVLLRKIEVAVGAMKVHARPKHVGIDDKYFLARWTCHFDGLTHGLPQTTLGLLNFVLVPGC
jgi:hypothetical protein